MHHIDFVLVVRIISAIELTRVFSSLFNRVLLGKRLEYYSIQAVSLRLSIHNFHDFLKHLRILAIYFALHFLIELVVSSEVWVLFRRRLVDTSF